MAFSNNYLKGDDSAADSDGCVGYEGEDYLQDSKTFRLRVRLTVLSNGSQEIWGLTNPSVIPLQLILMAQILIVHIFIT